MASCAALFMQCLPGSKVTSGSIPLHDSLRGVCVLLQARQLTRSTSRTSRRAFRCCRAKSEGEAFSNLITSAAAHQLRATPLLAKALSLCSRCTRAQLLPGLWALTWLQTLLSHTGKGLQRLLTSLCRWTFSHCRMQNMISRHPA